MKENDLLNTLIERAKEDAEQVVLDELAKSMRNLYDAYRRAGFDEKEAFRLTEIHAEGVTKETMRGVMGLG